VLALSACGSRNSEVSIRGEGPTTSGDSTTITSTVPPSTVPPTSLAPASTVPSTLGGFQAVVYGTLRFQVPDDWPVYELAKEPTRCVRFDQHAVYLGHAGANQDCPAHLVGRTEAVQVEPIDAVSQTTVSAATASGVINGLGVRLDPSSAITRNLIAAFDGLGLVATVTFPQSDALAQKILGTFERAGG
jgi:hypothetical protein